MNSLPISVVICTHNPRLALLGRSLAALRDQNFSLENWELIVIDNASNQDLSDLVDLSWHPLSKIVREDEIGLTPARLRGIHESKGDLLVFVDDDNVLDADYLQQAINLSRQWPMIGAYGGNCRGEYEVTPIASIRPYLSSLAVSEIDREQWSNAYEWSLATPYGAGMCLRRQVAEAYVHRVNSQPLLRATDRRGTVLTSGGDHDIVWTAIELGFGSARFPSLQLTHVISRGRLTEDYMVKLHAGFELSGIILAAGRAVSKAPSRQKWIHEVKGLIQAFLRKGSLRRRIEIAKWKARQSAFAFLNDADPEKLRMIDPVRAS